MLAEIKNKFQSKNVIYSPWERGQIGIKWETIHVIYQKLKKNIYVNRLKSVIFDI